MKRIFKILFINLILGILCFLLIEWFAYKEICRRYPVGSTSFFNFPSIIWNSNDIDSRFTPMHHSPFQVFNFNENQTEEGGIVLTGCSMVYGTGLKEKQTVSYKISNKLKTTVYNMSVPGGGLNQILYLLESGKIKKIVKKDPKYFIYFYNPDHLRRMFVYCTTSTRDTNFISYKKLGSKLKRKNLLILENNWFYSLIHDEVISDSLLTKILQNKVAIYYNLYLKEINSKIKQLYPNTKLVIVKFSQEFYNGDLDEDIDIIDIPELTGINVLRNDEDNIKKYNIDNHRHPNEYYWDIVVPVIIEELKKI